MTKNLYTPPCVAASGLVLLLLAAPGGVRGQSGLEIVFEDRPALEWTEPDRELASRIIVSAVRHVRTVMPQLTESIRVTVVPVDRDLGGVGGVTGRADAPGEVLIEMSTIYGGGVEAQAPALARTVYHEFHHLVRGWTIRENRFGPGIATAAVNEGLANVFAEQYTRVISEADTYPEEVEEWVREILALPTDADYGQWMFEHPDGRTAIGYRAGRYIIHLAMARSGRSVLELSELPPNEILALAGLGPS